ncbi:MULTISPECIES: branched-chain amino acid ABC transporter substrate-binding protein [unclassified Streptomyces]|uniref:branched-chain amino acid ABC transporter substrate-binding protein n=1 Tax=unclassified Streptomyces TaxID=2593676 RepID=UPI00278C1D41|nr:MULTISPECIES: branched-chain amino acid ABC transporter substrate-binding protein [unclassified Streptomyces]
MRHRSLLILTSVLTTGALTLSACGSRDEDKKSGDGEKTTVVIGVDAPLSGDLSAIGLGIKNSVDLAAKVANKNKEVPGVTFKTEPLDDVANASTGGQNATKLVGMKDVLGVVGPLNSNVAQSMQKTFSAANLVQISPANTNPTLTQGTKYLTSKQREFKTYFRTATTDALQGPFAAQYAYNQLKLKKVYVVDNKLTYGAGLAQTFRDEFKKLGGKVVATDHINKDDRDFGAISTKIKNSGADFVYFGGEYPNGAPLSKQIKDAGAKIPLIGGDALQSLDYVKLAGKAANGDFATSVGAPVDKLDTAKKFISDYQAGGYKEPYETYGGLSYDAAWAIIQAVKQVVNDNDGKLPSDARQKITEATQKVSFNGVTGQVAFDQYGDTTNKTLTVYQVKNGKHTPVKTGELEQ